MVGRGRANGLESWWLKFGNGLVHWDESSKQIVFTETLALDGADKSISNRPTTIL
jgi:hypothetical protein